MQQQADKWDLVIEPQTSWFSFNFSEVRRYKDLLWLFVLRDFKAQYKQTILGPVWHFLQPIFTTLMFLVVFTKIANINTGPVPPVLFYLSGITIWNFFSGTFLANSNTFISNASIFGKVYFPRIILPLSVMVSSMIRFAIQFLLFIAVALFWLAAKGYNAFHISWLALPALVIIMGFMALGIGILFSSLTTKYRDLAVLLSFAIQLLMYATPIAYPLSEVKNATLLTILKINPLTPVVENFRSLLFGSPAFDYTGLLYSILFTVFICFAGLIFFQQTEKSFMDTV